MAQTYLITGIMGFVGHNLARSLLARGDKVYGIDRTLNEDRFRILANVDQPPFSNIITDLNAQKAFDRIPGDEISCILHFAATPRIEMAQAYPRETFADNVEATLAVLEYARNKNIQRLVLASSSSIYGDQPISHIMHEHMIPNPLSHYAVHKQMSEQYCALYSHLYGLETICLRFFNIYGPGYSDNDPYPLVIPKFLKLKSENKPLTIYGDGWQTRSYTHIEDVIRATILAATHDFTNQPPHQVYNVGTSIATSVRRIAKLIGGPSEHIYPNPREGVEELQKVADYSRIQRDLGWTPRIGIAEGIEGLKEKIAEST